MLRTEINYEYYFNKYNCGRDGIIPPSDLDFYICKALTELEAMCSPEYTEEQQEAVMLTICGIADILYTADKTADIKNENIDGYSVTYAEQSSYKAKIRELILKNLGNTGLLYAGVD